MQRYIIVGTGVAGLAAAEIIRQRDPHGHLTIIGDDRDGYYSRPGIAYYLNRMIPERQLFPRSTAELRALIPTRIYARMTQILQELHQIVLDNDRHLDYDRLLLATGSRATMINFPGKELTGVIKLYTLEDVRSILKQVKRCREAVVIGDGIVGIELAEGLAAQGLRVHIFMLGDRLWPMVLDDTESRLVERGLAHHGIRLHPSTQMVEAVGRQGVLDHVLTKAGETIPCQLLGIAIGVASEMEPAKQAGLATDRGILVNEYLETSASDIFAAGNVAQIRDSRSGSVYMETLWATARSQGQVAGINLTGGRIAYDRETMFNVVCIGDIITATIGAFGPAPLTLTSSNPQDWQALWPVHDLTHGDHVNRVRVLVGERSIQGALVMGDQTLAQPLLAMTREETDLSSIRARLEAAPEQGIARLVEFYREEVRQLVRGQILV